MCVVRPEPRGRRSWVREVARLLPAFFHLFLCSQGLRVRFAEVVALLWLAVACGRTSVAPDPSRGGQASSNESAGHDPARPAGSAPDIGSAGSAVVATPAKTAACQAPLTLDILGDYLASDGSELWVRQSATALTLTRLPPGPARADARPTLWKVARVCAADRSFVLESSDASFERVDFAAAGSKVYWCMSAIHAIDVEGAVAAAPATLSDARTGCRGGPLLTLTRAQ